MLSEFQFDGSGTDVPAHLAAKIDSYFEHKPPPPADTWSEEKVFVPKKVSTFEGDFRFALVPWLREIVASIGDPECRSGSFVCGTQSAKTTGAKLLALFAAIILRINVVWLWPKAELGRSFCLTKFKPTLEASEKLRDSIPKNLDLYKNLEIHFEGGGVLNFVGSHSKVDSKSRSAGLVISDEIDDCAAKTKDDADPLTLLQERLKTFIEGKQYRLGSPTIASKPAWQSYLHGDQRHYFIPCPACGVWQSLELRDQVWILEGIAHPLPPSAPMPDTVTVAPRGRHGDFHLRWDPEARIGERDWDFDRVAASARYHCVACDHPITQQEKNHLVETECCRWVPTVRAKTEGARSWRLPALYPLWPGTTFAKNATTFLQTHHSVAGAQSYNNNWRALPHGLGHDVSDRAQVLKLFNLIKSEFALGERMAGKSILVVDVQRHYVIWALFVFGASTVHLIDVNVARDPDAIFAVDDEQKPDFVFMDSRYRSKEVYAAVMKRRERWFALRGEESGTALKANFEFDPFTGQREQGLFQITLLHLNTYTWGEELLARLYPPKDDENLPEFARASLTPATPAAAKPLDPAANPDAKLPRMRDFFLPYDMPERKMDKLKQLYNEYIIEYLDAKGKNVQKWTEHKDNHLFDLVKYAFAAGSFMGFTSIHQAVAAKVAAALATAQQQSQLPLTTPHGGTSLYPQS